MSTSFVAQRGTVRIIVAGEMPFEAARDAALLQAGYEYAAPRFRARILRVHTRRVGDTIERIFRIIRAGHR